MSTHSERNVVEKPGSEPGSIQRITDVLESVVGFVSDRFNCRQADDHDEGQHYGILNGGGTVFRDQKSLDGPGEIIHRLSLFLSRLSFPVVEPVGSSQC